MLFLSARPAITGCHPFDHTFFPSVRAMILTNGAVAALTAGAMSMDLDINAIDADGKEFFAPQVCCEDDKQVRAAIAMEEYNPVLEVVRTEWVGFDGMIPNIKIIVKDASDAEILMLVSRRSVGIAKNFQKKWGPGSTRKLSPGNRFRLMDYTTRMTNINSVHKEVVPYVSVETIRVEPKPKLQSKLTAFLAKNKSK